MPEPLVAVEGLTRVFRTGRGPLHAVSGLDLTLHEGEAVGLVGESGSGKSTVAKLMVGLDQPTGGTIRFSGRDLASASARESKAIRRAVGLVLQDPFSSLDPRLTVARSVEEPLIIHGWGDREQRRGRVSDLLDAVGLASRHADSRPQTLSGGERQRVAIARALALDPKLLVLDEPVSALDVSVQAQVLNLLIELRERLRLSYLLISHDLGVVRYVVDRVEVMFLGRIVERAPTEALLSRPYHPYTIALVSSAEAGEGEQGRILLQGDPPSPLEPPSGCVFRTRCFRARERCASEAPPLTADPSGRETACHFPGPLGSDPADERATRRVLQPLSSASVPSPTVTTEGEGSCVV